MSDEAGEAVQQQEEPSSSGAAEVETELTDEELANLLASTEHAGDGGAQIVDSDGNVITVSAEQLARVGIDIENMGELTEDQLSNLMNLTGGSTEPSAAVSTETVKADSSTSDGPPQLEDNSAMSGGDLTMVIGDDGSLKLVDASGAEFVLSPTQLQQHGIDVNNLTEQNIHAIVQLAMPSLTQEKSGSKRMKLDDSLAASSTDISSFVGDDSLRLMDDSNQDPALDHPGPQSLRRTAAGRQSGNQSSFSLIGQEVEVKKSGKTLPATIRYCRQGAGYKVQFEDGHFEWVSEDQIQLKSTTGRNRSDHTSYTEGELAAARAAQAAAVTNGLGSSGVGRRVPPAIPGIKVTPQGKDAEREPNFCCPICDKKVYQKEPAYIVIRLPACDTCADSKILVLDQDQEEKQ